MANELISKITLPNGVTYDIKDATARTDIANLKTTVASVMTWRGDTTTALSDGATTSPISIGDKSYTPSTGDVVNYGNISYAWNGTQWDQIGTSGPFKALAYKDNATATYKPAGTISTPTFTGQEQTVTIKHTPAGSVTVASGAVTTGTTANYTPSGSVSKPTFTGSAGTISVSGTPKGSVTISSATTGTANYTPAGTISVTPSVSLNTTSIQQITGVGTSPSWTGSVANETLTIGWSAGSLPTRAAATVATSVKSATATGSFTGTGAVLNASFTGSASSSTGSFTPSGSVSTPTFTGTGTILSATFTGSEVSGEMKITPKGTISTPIFTGTQTTITSK